MSFNLKANMNPELMRILRVTLPPRRTIFIFGLTLSLVLIVGGLVWNGYSNKTYMSFDQQVRRFGEDTYWALMVVLFGLLFILAPATAALSFIQEKLRGTAIFQQMMLMEPFDLALGKFLGSGLISYFVAAIILPFSLMAAALSNVNPNAVMRLYLFLFVGGFCCQAVGLFVSAVLSAPTEKALRGGLLVGPAVGVVGAIAGLGLHSYFDRSWYSNDYFWSFYGLPVPAFMLILGVMIFIGAWAFGGAVRRIKANQLISLSPKIVWLFFASAEAVLVGLLWGWEEHQSTIPRLVAYLFFNLAALTLLAGSSAMGRARLREWWSAGQDPLTLFQRQGIKNALKTFLVALGIAEIGLIALWASFHMNVRGLAPTMAISQLAPIAISFAVTVLAVALFIQFTAMQRFRIGGWAGVALAVVFYFIMGIAGAMFDTQNNTPALINPMMYAGAVLEGDEYMDRRYDYERYEHHNYPSTPYAMKQKPLDVNERIIHGLLAQGALAFSCFGLAHLKWKRTREEMLEERA